MNSNSSLSKGAKIYGIIITSLLLLLFGTKIIKSIIENGIGEFKEIAYAMIHWYDDPTAFFFSYLIGYVIVWWKPLLGSVIIIIGSILLFAFNIGNIGFIIFALFTLIVGILYIASWYETRKKGGNGA